MMREIFLINPSQEDIQGVMDSIPTDTGAIRLTVEDLRGMMDNARTMFALEVSKSGEDRMKEIIGCIEERCRQRPEGYDMFSARRMLFQIEDSACEECQLSELEPLREFSAKFDKAEMQLFGIMHSQEGADGDALTLRVVMVDFERVS